jgi:iron complex transport system substrate-binding protein
MGSLRPLPNLTKNILPVNLCSNAVSYTARMRIVSLLPSATEIVYALGLGESLVGVTHECDYPPEARAKPMVTASALDQGAESATIDRLVAGSVHQHRGIYTLDERLLHDLQPELILTQELCEVCAVSYREVERAARIMRGEVPIVSLEPRSLADILATINLVGSLTGREEAAADLVTGPAGANRCRGGARRASAHPATYLLHGVD